MIDYYFDYDITFIRELLDLSQEEFASKLNVTQVSVAMWETGKTIPNKITLEKIYNLAMENGIHLNRIKIRFFEDDKKDNVLLYHGSKKGIVGDLTFKHSNDRSDFGVGFYLGENLTQASTWVCDSENGSVYCFYLKNNSKLKVEHFDVDLDWVLAICLNRGYLKDKMTHPLINDIKRRIDNADIIVAPIADNVMYLTIQEFAEGYITDEQCKHALSANHLGTQYVCKTNKAIGALSPIARLYLCEKEKEEYREVKINEGRNGQAKSKAARIEFRNKGRYIDELFS